MTDENEVIVDALGRDVKTGRFTKGFAKAGPGRPKGSVCKFRQKFFDYVAEKQEAGMDVNEALLDMCFDLTVPIELRQKAMLRVSELLVPKASAVDLVVDENDQLDITQIDNKLANLIALTSHSSDE